MTARQVIYGREDYKYPLVISTQHVNAGASVDKFQPLFTFKFTGTAIETDEDGIDKSVPREFVEVFQSPVSGEKVEWMVGAGDTINDARSPLLYIHEACSHEVQWGGLCAACGKDLTSSDYLGTKDTSRATVAMAHDALGLKVSDSEAHRLESESAKRLLRSSRLSLVVDLDQCVIQTTVDPTVGEWLTDESNPNHDVLRDVAFFKIVEEGPGAPTYFVKPRPGLQEFLSEISKMYEMHIYTMGTRPYARQIAKIIDPSGQFFANRILSRDESGNSTHKSLTRLFPTDDTMVVIIDDRADVWQWCANLIKVHPFDFFIGIGDINGALLPVLDQASSGIAALSTPEQGTEGSPMERQVAVLEQQISVRPLAAQQKALEHTNQSAGSSKLLSEDDDQLQHLRPLLTRVHSRFYELHASSRRSTNVQADVKQIITSMKRQVLTGVIILFTGIFRSDKDPRHEWQGQLAEQFGARVLSSQDTTTEPTHVIVGVSITRSNLTEKSRIVFRKPWVKLVYVDWLLRCAACFSRADIFPYKVDPSLPDVDSPNASKRKLAELDSAEDLGQIRNGHTPVHQGSGTKGEIYPTTGEVAGNQSEDDDDSLLDEFADQLESTLDTA
ncbi:CTD phosphatase Fcp1 [Savitreella phatthalungensis]